MHPDDVVLFAIIGVVVLFAVLLVAAGLVVGYRRSRDHGHAMASFAARRGFQSRPDPENARAGGSATVLLESLVEHPEERLLLGGTANLTRNTADFGGSLRSVLEALEEQVVVLRLLAAQEEAGKVTVRIGHETEAEQMVGTSVVTTTYGSSGTVFGGMGVVGPTRMDYPGTMANVAAVAMYIGEVLGNRAG